MSSYTPVFVVLADEKETSFANQLANALGYPYAEIIVGTPLDAAYNLSAREKSPTYIYIDIGERGQDVLPEIDTLAEQCVEGTRVVVLGSVNDVKLYRELRQRGVIEYFTRSAKLSEIRSALIYDGNGGPQEGGRVVTLMSAASGDGSSTVALNIAFAMAEVYKKKTVLVDMDYQFGMIAKNLDLNPGFGIRELFEHPDRGIDATLIRRMTASYGEHLHIVAAPNDLRQMPDVNPEIIRSLIQTLRREYECVVVDLPHIWANWTSAAISNGTHSVMVAQLWLRSLTHASRLLGRWREIGIDDSNIKLVINRSGAKFKEGITAKDFEKVTQHDVNYYLDNDIKTIVAAENQGKTIIEVSQTGLATQFRQMAGQLLGLSKEEMGIQETTGKGFALFKKDK